MSNPLHMALEIAQWRTVPVYDGLHQGDGPEDFADDFACLFNKRRPEWSLSDLCEVLLELQSRDFIYFFWNHNNVPSNKTIRIKMKRESLTAALKLPSKELRLTHPHPDNLYYALTPEGGACWEAAAQADWSQYMCEWSGYAQTWKSVFGNINREQETWTDYPVEPDTDVSEDDNADWTDDPVADPEQVLLSSMNRDVIENWFAIDADMLKIVVPDSRLDGEVRPWHPLYWKTLPFAYRIGYSLFSQNARLTMDIPYKANEEIDALNLYTPNWYRSVFPPYKLSN